MCFFEHLSLDYFKYFIYCCVTQISYIVKYLVFSVSTAMFAHTKKQQVDSYIFLLLPHIFTIIGKPGSSNFLKMCKTLCFNQVLAPPLLSVKSIKSPLAMLHA